MLDGPLPISIRFDQWFSEQVASAEGITTTEAISLMMNLMARIRTKLTLEELDAVFHEALVRVEDRLQSGNAFLDDEGNTRAVLLAEERRELGMEEIEVPDDISELEA